MKITNITVKNFRSLQNVSIDPAKFSIFVGQNNHGKTNLFEAIDWFYNGKSSTAELHYLRNPENEILIEITFSDVLDSDIEKLKVDANKTKIRSVLDGSTSFSIRKSSLDSKRRYIVNGQDKGNPSGLDTAINEFIPKLEYVSTGINLDDVSKYKDKNPIGMMLSGVLTTIIETSVDYQNFKTQFNKLFESADSEIRKELDALGLQVEVYLQKQFPDGTKVKFGVNPPQFNDLLKSFETTIDDGVETRAEEKGDGMQRAIMLSIIQAFADHRRKKDGGGSFLFLIDEAELHLHPSAQRSLKRALKDIAHADQVFVNTHSSVLLVDDDKNQNIFKVEKSSGVTSINLIAQVEKIDVIFDLLGGSPADLLLPKNFLIVEGKSEFEFLSLIIKRFYSNEFLGIKVLFSGGDIDKQEGDLVAVHTLFKPLAGADNPIYRDKAIILIDRPNDKQSNKYAQFQEGYPYLFKQNQIFQLETETLEEYYPIPFKKTKGEIENNQKVAYAKHVAGEITQESFENNMSIIFNALKAAKERGF